MKTVNRETVVAKPVFYAADMVPGFSAENPYRVGSIDLCGSTIFADTLRR